MQKPTRGSPAPLPIPASRLTLCAGFLLLALTGAAAMAAGDAAAPAPSMRANPLLTESTLPYHYPPFDQIKDEDYLPAYEKGMDEQLQEVAAIASSPEKPTFENTLVALERSGQLLHRVGEIFDNLASANTNPAMQAVERQIAPRLAAQEDAIHLNPALFARIQAVYDARAALGLDPESLRLVERYHRDYVRAGARLPAADQVRLKALNADLAGLQTTFSQNVLKEVNASVVVVDNRADLAGMSDAEIAAAAAAAKAQKLGDKYVIRLLNTSGQPALGSLENRALRERIQKASVARGSRGGEFDNRELISRIARLRAERAALLGYGTHADYILEDETAGTVPTVNQFLARLAPPAVANARREAAEMQAIIDGEHGGFQLAAWDWDFYSEKVRRARFAFDEAEVRPYFELNHVLQDGVFYAARCLYGITFKERHDLPVYQADVRVFEVFDADGKPLALFIGDYFARPSKRGGAWMNAYVGQSALLGTRPVVANHLNIPHPPAGDPALLTFDEVTTMFHEFGHALHGMFSDIRYPRLANVPRDFVEYPSQFNEMWAVWPEVLRNYARHYRTGEPMPAALLEKVLAMGKFNQGFTTTEYLEAALIDQAWHQLKPAQIPADPVAFEAEALRKAGVEFAPVPPRYHSTYFSHVFSGIAYSAGYYAYIWAEVLDADSAEWVKQHGGMTRENGDRYRKLVLARGGTRDAITLFRDYTGGDPDVGPLLKRRGLDQAQPTAAK